MITLLPGTSPANHRFAARIVHARARTSGHAARSRTWLSLSARRAKHTRSEILLFPWIPVRSLPLAGANGLIPVRSLPLTVGNGQINPLGGSESPGGAPTRRRRWTLPVPPMPPSPARRRRAPPRSRRERRRSRSCSTSRSRTSERNPIGLDHRDLTSHFVTLFFFKFDLRLRNPCNQVTTFVTWVTIVGRPRTPQVT